MLEIERLSDIAAYVGKELGTSEWLTVDQAMIDTFAEVTGDDQWIHIDVERAKREMPDGKTIAHGYLTVSLIPRLLRGIWRVKQRSRSINYGSNKIRFLNPVQSGDRIRLVQSLKAADPVEGGQRLTFESKVEIEGKPRPAAIAETIALAYD
ncbi:Acyl dehydratase [Rhizobiales bacterium GAS191]|nr:Acyl dehydratase [Rhizobiales bacterium GAS113]SEC20809.1 Acyl dehydratase [Rhizobiales bacterium GAS191]